jgi:hypothetical protein
MWNYALEAMGVYGGRQGDFIKQLIELVFAPNLRGLNQVMSDG